MKTLRVLLLGLLLLGVGLLSPGPAAAQEPVEAWLAVYEGPGLDWDEARAVAVDGAGDVYVTGGGSGPGPQRDYATIRYDGADGTLLWVATYNGSGNWADQAVDIALDGNGDVFVTGFAAGATTNEDWVTMKYDGNTGALLWPQPAIYDGPASHNDEAAAMALDGNGDVYVTGWIRTGPNAWDVDWATIKYSGANGNQLWVSTYNGPGNLMDQAVDIAVDGAGDVYVTGYSTGVDQSSDYTTITYNGSNGAQVWVQHYTWGGQAVAIALDAAGNVYVTGTALFVVGGLNYATLKYDASGVHLWTAIYDGPASSVDEARAIAVHGGNVYVTGWAWGGPGTADDFATVAYDANTGNPLWPGAAIYNGSGNSADQPTAIAVDGNGDVYVTGHAFGPTSNNDYATIKYDDANGAQLWVVIHNDPDNGVDEASAIALDGAGNVYVTGRRSHQNLDLSYDYDYGTIKYAQVPDIAVAPPMLQASLFPDQAVGLALSITNAGTADLAWNLFENPPVGWLSQDITAGNMAPGASQQVTVTFDSTGLGVGTYTTTLHINSNDPDGPLVLVPVTLVVTAGLPDIDVAPNVLTQTLLPDQSAIVLLTIANTGTAALAWNLFENPPVGWLAQDITAGNMAPGVSQQVQVKFNSFGLAPGTYNTMLNVNSNDPNDPTVPVTATLIVLAAVPDIDVSPSSLTQTLIPNQTAVQLLTIANTGNAVLAWNVAESPDAGWVLESPNADTVAPGGSQQVIVKFDSTGLAPGAYATTLKIGSNDPDESVVYVDVTLIVTAPVPVVVTMLRSHVDPTDGAAGVALGFQQVYDPATGQPLPNVLIAGYQATFVYPPDLVEVTDCRLMPPFDLGACVINNNTGVVQFNAVAAAGAAWPVNVVALLTTRLKGSMLANAGVTLTVPDIVDVNTQPLQQEAANTGTLRRGNAKPDGVISVADVLRIAQYVVGLIGCGPTLASDVNCANAASPKWDDPYDKVLVSDAIKVAQYLVGLADADLRPLPSAVPPLR